MQAIFPKECTVGFVLEFARYVHNIRWCQKLQAFFVSRLQKNVVCHSSLLEYL